MNRTVGAVGAFVVLSIALVAWLAASFMPRPVYVRYRLANVPAVAVTASHPLDFAFDLPEVTPSRIELPVRAWSDGRELALEVAERETGRVLASAVVERPQLVRLDLATPSDMARRLVLRVRAHEYDPTRAPALHFAALQPDYDGATYRGLANVALDEPVANEAAGPLLAFDVAQPARVLLPLWLLVLPGFLLVRRRERATGAYLCGLALLALVTSVLFYDQNCRTNNAQLDADGYAKSATQLARWLTEPEARPAIESWYRGYPHTHNAGVPALLAPFVALGVPVRAAYVELEALAGFFGLLLFYRLLRRRLALSHRAALWGVTLLACHHAALRTFGRPITDGFGLFLVLASLELVLVRLGPAPAAGRSQEAEPPSRANGLGLALVMFLHLVARPQGPALVLFFAGALVVVERWRAGAWRPSAIVRTLLFVVLLPCLAYGSLFLAFGWQQNVRLMLEKAANYHTDFTLLHFAAAFGGLVQLLPLAWCFARLKGRPQPVGIVLALGVFYLVMLLAVRAPLWLRHFLPLLPVAITLAVLAWDSRDGWRRKLVAAVLTLVCVTNVAGTVWLTEHYLEPVHAYQNRRLPEWVWLALYE